MHYVVIQDLGLAGGLQWHTGKSFRSQSKAERYVSELSKRRSGDVPNYQLFTKQDGILGQLLSVYFGGKWNAINPVRQTSSLMEKYLNRRQGINT